MGSDAASEIPCTAPRWPRSIFANLLLALLFASSVVAYCPQLPIVQTGILSNLHKFGLLICGDQETIVLVMKAAYWIHLMESIYACYICRRCKINTIHTMGWVSLTLGFGFPAIACLNELCAKIRDDGKELEDEDTKGKNK